MATQPVARTGYTYDELMLKHECPWAKDHHESPLRLSSILDRCRELKLFDRCLFVKCTKANDDDILLYHNESLLKSLSQAPCKNIEQLKEFCQTYDDVYINEFSLEAAKLAVGGSLNLLDSIMTNKCQNGFALVRPPGHHAMENEMNGFCLFNNVVITAKTAIEKYNLQRVLIIDWDVHHGQGTQYAFYDTNKVLCISTHRYEYGQYWPSLAESDFDFIGEGDGQGFNVNIPLNKTGLKNADYLYIFFNIILPIAYEYDPDLVLVSAGYDVALGCPEGEMKITPDTFAHLTHYLKGLANGKVMILLEGGYCIDTLAEGAVWTLRSLLGDPCSPLQACTNPDPIVKKTVACCKNVLKDYWQSLRIDLTDKCEIWIKEAKRKQALIPLINNKIRPIQYDLTPTLIIKQTEEQLLKIQQDIKRALELAPHQKPLERGRTLLVYDELMKKFHSRGHCERPGRIEAIWKGVQSRGLDQRCKMIPSRLATKEEILLAHNDEFYELMKSTKTASERQLKQLKGALRSVEYTNDVFDNALLAAGSCLNMIDAIMTDEGRNGFAIVRPPGHHAHCSLDYGFCYFNNVAICARYLQRHYNLQRILIIDFDYHMGDGVKDVFYEDPGVLYISLHCYDAFPPNEGHPNDSGKDKGLGYNINIGWLKFDPPAVDADYINAFHHVILPIAYEYNPEFVLVCAGFDAAEGDRIGWGKLSACAYSQMTHMLLSLANGRVLEVLEGGYCLHQLNICGSACVATLLGDSPIRCSEDSAKYPQDLVSVRTIQMIKDIHRSFWTSLFTIPDQNENAIDKLAENLEKTAIKNN
ncbi:unnamed protein product [Rotaria sordida]|uniref:Histone deacetylase domain-containing protein n=1 Tax=Rotaria sordida TaxID=392033 RepID=A0A813WDJ9_9BILA|nr:unnamed protein product [Rotaria sordida]CAF0919100.1 unnamed protein product [Rotaria sordida]